MRTTLFIIALSIALCAKAQKVFSTPTESQADVKVFVVDKEYRADIIVFRTDREYRAKASENKGIWYFTDKASRAEKKIYFVDKDYRADLKTANIAQAGKTTLKST